MGIAVRNTLFFVASTTLYLTRIQVHGATMTNLTVRCLPENPTVCVGQTSMSTPIPHFIDGVLQYIGRYSWAYHFVEGLQDGTLNDLETTNEHMTGLMVEVHLDYDKTTCEVQVNGELCNWCSTTD